MQNATWVFLYRMPRCLSTSTCSGEQNEKRNVAFSTLWVKMMPLCVVPCNCKTIKRFEKCLYRNTNCEKLGVILFTRPIWFIFDIICMRNYTKIRRYSPKMTTKQHSILLTPYLYLRSCFCISDSDADLFWHQSVVVSVSRSKFIQFSIYRHNGQQA